MPFPSIAGLTARYETFDASGYTIDGSNRCSAFIDRAGVYGNLVQATNDNKPVLTPNVFGNAPALLFDGINDVMDNDSAITNLLGADGVHEMFIVVRAIHAGATYSSSPGIFCGKYQYPIFSVCAPLASGNPTQYIDIMRGTSHTGTTNIAGAINKRAYILNACQDGSGTSFNSFLRDGYARSRLVTGSPSGSPTTNLQLGVQVGLSRLSGIYCNMWLGAIIVFNRKLTIKERQQVCDYLTETYAIQYPAIWVDQTDGNDSTGDGLNQSTSYKTYKTSIGKSMITGAYGLRIIMANNGTEDTTGSNAGPAISSTQMDPIRLMNWARPSILITSATWTQGSNDVTNIVGVTLSDYAHADRYITGPDGLQYTIEFTTAGDALKLLEKYKGASVSGVSGAATIQADEQWAYCRSLNALDGADRVATWDADGHTRPRVYNSASGNYLFTGSGNYWTMENIVWGDCAATSVSNVSSGTGNCYTFIGCMVFRSNNVAPIIATNTIKFRKCHVKGPNNVAYTTNICITLSAGATVYLQDCGFSYGYASIGLPAAGYIAYLKNCNLGVNGQSTSGREIQNSGTATFAPAAALYFDCVEFHPSSTEMDLTVQTYLYWSLVRFYSQNHNRVYGAHKQNWMMFGTVTLNTGTGVTLPADETDGVLEILLNTGNEKHRGRPAISGQDSRMYAPMIFEQIIRVPEAAHTLEWKINSERFINSDEMFIEVEYQDRYQSTSDYRTMIARSSNDIEERTAANDWTQKCSVTITPKAGPDGYSTITVRAFVCFYDATNKAYASKKIRAVDIAGQTIMSYGMPVFAGAANVATYEAGRNDKGTLTAEKLRTGVTVKILGETFNGSETPETHTANQVLKSAGGNWNDDNLGEGSENNVKALIAYGLSQTGSFSGSEYIPADADTLVGMLAKLVKALYNRDEIVLEGGKYYEKTFDDNDITVIRKCELKDFEGNVPSVISESNAPAKRMKNEVTTSPALPNETLVELLARLISHRFHLHKIEEIPAGSGVFYETTYDATGRRIAKCLLNRFGGGNIGSPANTGDPVIREKSEV